MPFCIDYDSRIMVSCAETIPSFMGREDARKLTGIASVPMTKFNRLVRLKWHAEFQDPNVDEVKSMM